MTDRRRNLFVLLLVAGLLAASALAIITKPTRLGLDLQGGVSLIYQAEPTKQAEVNSESIERAIDIMRKRVDQLGVAEPEIQRSGEDQIDVSLPDVENADEAAQQVGTTAQLFFYDWEANVLGPGCRPDPRERGGHRRAAGRQRGRCAQPLRRGQARRDVRAAGLRRRVDTPVLPRRRAGQARAGRPRGERGRGAAGRARAQPGRRLAAARSSVVPQGTIVVRAEPADEDARPPDRWYVLRDKPALSGTDIKNPEQNFDQGAGGTGGPERHLRVHRHAAQELWQETTREIAQRGQETFFGGDPSGRLPALRDRAGQRADLGAVHRLPAEPRRHRRRAPARRSRAASRSSRPSAWPTCSRPARCRSSWS